MSAAQPLTLKWSYTSLVLLLFLSLFFSFCFSRLLLSPVKWKIDAMRRALQPTASQCSSQFCLMSCNQHHFAIELFKSKTAYKSHVTAKLYHHHICAAEVLSVRNHNTYLRAVIICVTTAPLWLHVRALNFEHCIAINNWIYRKCARARVMQQEKWQLWKDMCVLCGSKRSMTSTHTQKSAMTTAKFKRIKKQWTEQD